METKRPYIRVWACRHVAAPDHPEAGCRNLPLERGPVTIQGVPDPMGGPGFPGDPDLYGRSGASGRSGWRQLLPEHVVLPGLSQSGNGSGTAAGCAGLRTAGVRLLVVVKDNYKALA